MTDPEMNRVLNTHYDEIMSKEEKKIVGNQIARIRQVTRVKSGDRAKIGRVSALEILYKLGRLLNKKE